jgi:hypothetical protein
VTAFDNDRLVATQWISIAAVMVFFLWFQMALHKNIFTWILKKLFCDIVRHQATQIMQKQPYFVEQRRATGFSLFL